MKKETKLKKYLKRKHIIQKGIAEEAGINYFHFNRIVNGYHKPTVGQASKIAKVLNVPIDEIFE